MKSLFGGILFFFSCFFCVAQNTRLEHEIKLNVPLELSDSVWNYITTTYNNNNLGYKTTVAVEVFNDQYYDTKDFKLLKSENCIRYRKRFYENGESKELIQIKTAAKSTNNVLRNEIKFKPKKDLKSIDKITKCLKEKDKFEFQNILNKINISSINSLNPSIYITQQRSRVYLSKNDQSVSTITLDKAAATYNNNTVNFIEIELELNEVTYTSASDSEKLEMEKITAKIKQDLLSKFPQIIVDQTPKYVKAAKLLQIEPKQIKATTRVFKYILPLAFLAILAFVIQLIRKNKK